MLVLDLYMSIIQSAKGTAKFWQTIDKIRGKIDEDRNLQQPIKNQLVDDPVVAATEFNTFLKKFSTSTET